MAERGGVSPSGEAAGHRLRPSPCHFPAFSQGFGVTGWQGGACSLSLLPPQERECKPPADRWPPAEGRLFYCMESIGFLPSNVFSKSEITSPDAAASDGGWGCYFGKPILQGKEWNSLPPICRRSFRRSRALQGQVRSGGQGEAGRAGAQGHAFHPLPCGSGKGGACRRVQAPLDGALEPRRTA